MLQHGQGGRVELQGHASTAPWWNGGVFAAPAPTALSPGGVVRGQGGGVPSPGGGVPHPARVAGGRREGAGVAGLATTQVHLWP